MQKDRLERPGRSESASSEELLNEALDSCLERLCEIEEKILNKKAQAVAVKAVMIDIIKANGLSSMKNYKKFRHGSFQHFNGKLYLRLKP